jgi:hypothetical protein
VISYRGWVREVEGRERGHYIKIPSNFATVEQEMPLLVLWLKNKNLVWPTSLLTWFRTFLNITRPIRRIQKNEYDTDNTALQ